MSDFTAIVLTAGDDVRRWPGIELLVRKQRITNAAELHAARLDALARVQTEFCFYLDDDDDLPADYMGVLEDCRAVCNPIAYTDEKIVSEDGTRETLVKGAYSRKGHYDNVMLLHHLVLCNTAAAVAVAARLPRGHFWTEFLLYWELARNGAGYVPRVGHVWNRRPGRINTFAWASVSQMRSKLLVRDEALVQI